MSSTDNNLNPSILYYLNKVIYYLSVFISYSHNRLFFHLKKFKNNSLFIDYIKPITVFYLKLELS